MSPSNASRFYQHLQQRGAVVQGIQGHNIPAVLSSIAHLSQGAVFAWRGQDDVSWEPTPTLYRRVQDSGIRFSRNAFLEYEHALYKSATRLGYAERDIESTMAKLQHHGAATRFLDFTLDLTVALWFAVNDEGLHGQDGVVIGYDITGLQGVQGEWGYNPTPYTAIAFPETWTSAPLVSRAAASDRQRVQRGLFVVPRATTGDYRDMLPPDDAFVGRSLPNYLTGAFSAEPHSPPRAVAVRVKSVDKPALRHRIITASNIDNNYLFPDLAGFCQSRAAARQLGSDQLPRIFGTSAATFGTSACLCLPHHLKLDSTADGHSWKTHFSSTHELQDLIGIAKKYKNEINLMPIHCWAAKLDDRGQVIGAFDIQSLDGNTATMRELQGAALDPVLGLFILPAPEDVSWRALGRQPRGLQNPLALLWNA